MYYLNVNYFVPPAIFSYLISRGVKNRNNHKHINGGEYHEKKSILTVISFLLTASLTACFGGEFVSSHEVQPARIEGVDVMTGSAGQSGSQSQEDSPGKEATSSFPSDYSILTYTGASDQNSSVSIQYPFFEGEGNGALNDLILAKVQGWVDLS